MGLVDGLTAQGRTAWLPEREGGLGDAGAPAPFAVLKELQPIYAKGEELGGWAPAAQGRPARRSSPTLRAASRRRRTVPDACRLGLGRTVRHDPYRIGPQRGEGGRFEGGIGEAALLCGQAALGADRRQSCDQSFKTCMKSG
jgi:hypothetical protein